MSKRSSRRKRRQRQEKQQARLTAPVLVEQGLKAFQAADYNAAIKAWEQAQRKPDAPKKIEAAIAEAYFRRSASQPAPDLTALKLAVKLQPKDQLYRYHLALAHHRQGELEQAGAIYRQLLAESPAFERAAAPLAQLLIEQKTAVLQDPVWEQLDAETQAQLAAAEALVKSKAESTLQRLSESDLHPFWQGLTALALNDIATAHRTLQPIAQTPDGLHPQVRGVARYYLGLLAAQAGQTEAAVAHWRAAQADGIDSRHLQQNLSTLALKEAIAAQQAGQPQKAVDLLDKVKVNSDIRGDINDFYQRLNLDLGYKAAQKGDWEKALTYWQKAENTGDDSRRLLFNLALTYQKLERFLQAADYWRTLLRRRPRKTDDPDYLDDQQVARIWQNVAENYSRAGDYEESIKTYKNAVKWAPENVDLRLQLVEAYQNEGRWQAAENELNRVLDKDPDNIRALTLLGESYSDDYSVEPARDIWLRILKLEPNNPIARQQLAHTYEREGERWLLWQSNYQRAIEIYKEGLKHVPESQRLKVLIGGAYAEWGKLDLARDFLEQARAANPSDLSTLHTIAVIWLQFDSIPDFREAVEHIKALDGPVPFGLYMDLFRQCSRVDEEEEGFKILEYVVSKFKDDPDALVAVASEYSRLEMDNKALPILREVVKSHPKHIEANLQLGIVYHFLNQSRLAKRYWDKAEGLARNKKDPVLIHRVKLVKDEYLYGKRVPDNPLQFFMSLPPEVREQALKSAPPEIAQLLRNMDPEMMEMFSRIAGLSGFDDDEFFDEDEFYGF